MAVDRGGLNYPIRVIDEFTANTQKFRDEIRKSREEFVKFRRSARALNARLSTDQKEGRRILQQASKDQKAADKERGLRFKENIKQQEILRKNQVVTNKARKVETQRLAALEEKTAKNKLKFTRQSTDATRQGVTQGKLLRRSLVEQDGAANKLLFTFRRLVGVLALFTVARQVAAGFGALVRSGFEFNQTVERSRLGIAGIITAVGQVSDEQGKVVKGAEAFVVATGLARKQQQALQRDALLTTATFEELLNVFQIATGPGLAAGLELDQIRKISVLVSQAASAIDLPQNQLSEEIRALLTGNIRTTTTRIAQVLNLTPADVKGAIRQGDLFELLTNRLQGFSLAAEKTANTVGGLAARIKGALQVIAGEANAKGFESLREVLRGVFNNLLLIKRDAKGAIESFKLNPDAVRPFTAIFDAIDGIIKASANLGATVGFEGLTSAAEGFAGALGVVGQGIAIIVTGVVSGFANIKDILSVVLAPFAAIAGLVDKVFGEGALNIFLAAIVQVVVAFTGLKLVLGLLLGLGPRLVKVFVGLVDNIRQAKLAMNLLLAGTKIWVAESKIGAATWKVISSRVTLALGAMGLLAIGAAKFLTEILGVKVELLDLPEVLGGVFENFFAKIIALGNFLFTTIKVRTAQAFNTVVSAAGGAVEKLKALFDLELLASDDLKGLRADDRKKDAEERATRLKQENALLEVEINEAKLEGNQIIVDTNKREGDLLNKLRERKRLEEEIASGAAASERAGSARSAPKQLTDSERQSAIQDERRLKLLSVRLTTTRRIAQIEAQRISDSQKDLQILKTRSNELKNELAVRDKALRQEEAIAKRALEQASQPGASTDDKLLAAEDKLARIQERRKLISFDLATAKIEEAELERQIGIEARGFLAIGREKIAQAKRNSEFAVQLLESDRARAVIQLSSATSDEQKIAILDRIKRLNIDITTQKALQAQADRESRFELDLAAARARGDAGEGLGFGIDSFVEEFRNSFDATMNIARQSIEELASFISGALSDALDPNSDTSIKERFGFFLQSISKLIIAELTKLAIASALIRIGFGAGPAPGATTGGSIGRAQGGQIPRRGRASLHHYRRPRGMVAGGVTPPAGVDRRDTTPIWAQPGEFMIRLAAVRKYGLGVMEAINSGVMDPTSLASMIGARRIGNRRRKIGYADGGSIGTPSQAADVAGTAIGSSDGGGGGVGVGLLVASEQVAERFLGGGRKAFLDFIDEHGADIDGRLARFRS